MLYTTFRYYTASWFWGLNQEKYELLKTKCGPLPFIKNKILEAWDRKNLISQNK